LETDMNEFQNRIGYRFRDTSLLKQALTHSSLANEMHLGHMGSNERLEFLGDSVLELVSSEFFYQKFPLFPEGDLTKRRAAAVCEVALAFCADEIHLGDYLLLGKGEDMTGGRTRPSVTSDALEALIGAIYLDGGFQKAEKFILGFILNETEEKSLFYDAKTNLQEQIQKTDNQKLSYEQISEEGPGHDKIFTCAVLLNGEEIGRGKGSSKKNAEQMAAFEALKKIPIKN